MFTDLEIRYVKAHLDPESESKLEAAYDNFLDEVFPSCKIANSEYNTSRALAEIDPTAYRCGFADWLDGELENIYYVINGEYYAQEDVDDLIDIYEAENEEKEDETDETDEKAHVSN